MPLRWTIDHRTKLVTAEVTGAITVDELYDYLGSLIANLAMPYPKIFDVSGATDWIPEDSMRAIAHTIGLYAKMKLGAVGPLAIVVGEAGVERAKQFVRTVDARRPVRLFREVNEARSWIDSLRRTVLAK
jgi:hypothetical protein